ncbi:hypothetical protein GGR56DRAFT_660766 [Xylariaceae sp. FL0804]|nr:hypothetical protein GGR56DRAFT_660766 [Xylariaceae sp. FL0804]
MGLGYFRDDARTPAAFFHDSHASAEFHARGWCTIHKTGDRGRLIADGSLIVEVRIVGDTQIKLRGIRNHLEEMMEIEAAIFRAGNDRITDVAVSVRQGGEVVPQHLVAHVVLIDKDPVPSAGAIGEKGEVNVMSFLAQVATRLPLAQHMKPSVLAPVARLPLSSSKKLYRRQDGRWGA